MPAFVLASGSTGRLRVLQQAGIDPEIVVSGVDETAGPGLDTAALVTLLAERKAAAVAAQRPDALVRGGDSMLDLDGEALGKPASAEQATAMWHRLAGRQATLFTGHCLISPGGRRIRDVTATAVRFGRPTSEELAAYVATGEPMQLAGAFSIEGRGAPFLDGIDGDASNVIGLSLPALRRMLTGIGLNITDLWRN